MWNFMIKWGKMLSKKVIRKFYFLKRGHDFDFDENKVILDQKQKAMHCYPVWQINYKGLISVSGLFYLSFPPRLYSWTITIFVSKYYSFIDLSHSRVFLQTNPGEILMQIFRWLKMLRSRRKTPASVLSFLLSAELPSLLWDQKDTEGRSRRTICLP